MHEGVASQGPRAALREILFGGMKQISGFKPE